MRRDELWTRIQAAAEAHGVKPLSERVFDSWVEKRLVPGPTPRGRRRGVPPDWIWPAEACAAAEKIVWLSSKGVRRTAAHVVHLWVYGFDHVYPKLSRSLEAEFERIRNRTIRLRQSKYRYSDVDTRLVAAGFVLEPRVLRELQPILERGAEGKHTAAQLLADEVRRLTGLPVTPHQIADITRGIEGVFGISDETEKDLLSHISRFDRSDFEAGREQFVSILRAHGSLNGVGSVGQVDFRGIPGIILGIHSAGDWVIVSFAQMAFSSFKSRTAGDDTGRSTSR